MNEYINKARSLFEDASKIQERCIDLAKSAMAKAKTESVDLSTSDNKARLYFYYQGDSYEGDCYPVVAETSEICLIQNELNIRIHEGTEDESLVNDACPLFHTDFALNVIKLVNEKTGNLESELQEAISLSESYETLYSQVTELFNTFICNENVEYVDLREPVESTDYAYGETEHEFTGEITSFINTEERPFEFGLDYGDVSYGGMIPVDPFHFILNLIETHFDS